MKPSPHRVAARHLEAWSWTPDWSYTPGQALYHGTPRPFDRLQLGGEAKVLWLTDSRDAAGVYARPYYVRSDVVYLWEIHLKPSARILDLKDLSNPIARALKDKVSEFRTSTWGAISDEDWPSFADFGIVEGYSWVRPFLRSKRVDGVWVDDRAGSKLGHRSIALLNLGAIASATKTEEPR